MIRQSKQRKKQILKRLVHKKQHKRTKWKNRHTPPTEDEIREAANCLYSYPDRKIITFRTILEQAETQFKYTFKKREKNIMYNRIVELNNFYESPSTKAPAAETPTTSTKESPPKVTPTKPKQFRWDANEEGSEVNVGSSGAEEDDTRRDHNKKPSSHQLSNTTSHTLKDCTPKKQTLESSSSSSDCDDDNFAPNKKNLGRGSDLSDSDPEECTFTDHPKNDSSDNSHFSNPRGRLDEKAKNDEDDFIDNRSSSSMTHYGQASDSSVTF